jgi:N-acetylmuramoyl-L-alanine amidase
MLKLIYSFIPFLFISSVLFAQPVKVLLGEAKEDMVNVRTGANINFESISQLEKGEAVEIIGEQYDWYKIRLPKSTTCYVSEKFLILLSDSELAQVIGSNVNIRSKPNLNSAVLGKLDEGSTVKIRSKSPDYLEIDCPEDVTGWVMKSLLQVENNANFEQPADKKK